MYYDDATSLNWRAPNFFCSNWMPSYRRTMTHRYQFPTRQLKYYVLFVSQYLRKTQRFQNNGSYSSNSLLCNWVHIFKVNCIDWFFNLVNLHKVFNNWIMLVEIFGLRQLFAIDSFSKFAEKKFRMRLARDIPSYDFELIRFSKISRSRRNPILAEFSRLVPDRSQWGIFAIAARHGSTWRINRTQRKLRGVYMYAVSFRGEKRAHCIYAAFTCRRVRIW